MLMFRYTGSLPGYDITGYGINLKWSTRDYIDNK